MKYLITERQLKLIKEQDEILKLDFDFFNKNWNVLQKFLERRGNPPYIITGNLNLKPAKVITLGSLVGVEGGLDLGFSKTIEDLGNLQYVLGYLDLGRTNIESLGKLKYVSGSLDLRRTRLSQKMTEKEISSQVEVGGNIYL